MTTVTEKIVKNIVNLCVDLCDEAFDEFLQDEVAETRGAAIRRISNYLNDLVSVDMIYDFHVDQDEEIEIPEQPGVALCQFAICVDEDDDWQDYVVRLSLSGVVGGDSDSVDPNADPLEILMNRVTASEYRPTQLRLDGR